MKFAGIFARVIAPIMAALGRVMSYIRGGKSRSVTEGFHVNRSGKVIYPRGYRGYMRRLSNWKRGASMRTGGPVLTGKRLERVSKSSCPANLLVQPRYYSGVKHCACGQHLTEKVMVNPNMATAERVAELRKLAAAQIAAECAIPEATLGRAPERNNVISIDEVFSKVLSADVVPS